MVLQQLCHLSGLPCYRGSCWLNVARKIAPQFVTHRPPPRRTPPVNATSKHKKKIKEHRILVEMLYSFWRLLCFKASVTYWKQRWTALRHVRAEDTSSDNERVAFSPSWVTPSLIPLLDRKTGRNQGEGRDHQRGFTWKHPSLGHMLPTLHCQVLERVCAAPGSDCPCFVKFTFRNRKIRMPKPHNLQLIHSLSKIQTCLDWS